MMVRVRYPGRAGGGRVSLTLRVGGNVLADDGADFRVLRGVNEGDVVWVSDVGSPAGSPPSGGTLFTAKRFFDDQGRGSWKLHPATGTEWDVQALFPNPDPDLGDRVHVVSVTLGVKHVDRTGRVTREEIWENLGFADEGRNSLTEMFAARLATRTQELRIPVIFDAGATTGAALAAALVAALGGNLADLPASSGAAIEVSLKGGLDGLLPGSDDYRGDEDPDDPGSKTGLRAMEDIVDVSIIAAPGYSAGGNESTEARQRTQAVSNALVSHATRPTRSRWPTCGRSGRSSTVPGPPSTSPGCRFRTPSTGSPSSSRPAASWRGSTRATTWRRGCIRPRPTRWCAAPWASR
jgi:uncharacterized protein